MSVDTGPPRGPFLLILLLLLNTLPPPAVGYRTREYKVTVRLRESIRLIELHCPNYHSAPNDVLIFRDSQKKELMRAVLKEGEPVPVLAISTDELNLDSKVFEYGCGVMRPQINEFVSIATFIVVRQGSSSEGIYHRLYTH